MATEAYRLLLMPPAADELEDIYAYIAGHLDAPAAAQKLMLGGVSPKVCKRQSPR
jgi:hypothetical protein